MKTQSEDILVTLIGPDPDQPRKAFAPESLAELGQSIREVGVLMPILVRQVNGRFVIIDGERRWRAAVDAGCESIPAVVQNGELSAAEKAQRALIANIQRDDLTALEKSRAIEGLMKATDWSAAETAGKLGMSKASVTRLLSLLTLPLDMLSKVELGEISPSAAYQLSRVGDEQARSALAGQVAEKTLTRDALARKLRKAKHGTCGTDATSGRTTALLGGGRTVSIAAPGLTLERCIELLEELLSKARKAKQQGISLGTFTKALRDQAKAGV